MPKKNENKPAKPAAKRRGRPISTTPSKGAAKVIDALKAALKKGYGKADKPINASQIARDAGVTASSAHVALERWAPRILGEKVYNGLFWCTRGRPAKVA